MNKWIARFIAAASVVVLTGGATAPQQPVASPETVVPPGLRVKLLDQHDDGTRAYELVFEPGAEVMSTLSAFVLQNHFNAVDFVGLGACSDAVVAYYDPAIRDYRRTTYTQQMEIVSIIGDAAPTNGQAGLHIHIGLGFADGTMHGGHLFATHASPTLEMRAVVSPVSLHRRHDPAFNAELLVP